MLLPNDDEKYAVHDTAKQNPRFRAWLERVLAHEMDAMMLAGPATMQLAQGKCQMLKDLIRFLDEYKRRSVGDGQ